MRELVYVVGTTLDGRVAGPDDEIDFFFPLAADVTDHLRTELADTLPSGARAALGVEGPVRRFDTVVMGRRTYEPALREGIVSPYAHLRQYVVSSTLPAPADPAVTVVRDRPLDLVRRVKAEDGLDILLAGGGRLAAEVLDEVDRIVVKHYPLLAGDGVPLLAGAFRPLRLTVKDERRFSDGACVVTYVPRR
ncbi:dihydrofolate reductase family protein [Motilibacter deserti]|uniref:Dihydrofolate reductase n=1 Tax=Motilibacter deserti TaxID=2714956 RepID=A0ABX0GVL8_9ACTN|nr:dihydrofolate reductase family protein [Motilibacter deserti]NHC14558.1 dihydrofolate reductase [Motilibacter deserti]